MAKRMKMPTDVHQRAKAIVDFAPGIEDVPARTQAKDPAAVALGRKGGLRGGKFSQLGELLEA